MGDLGLVKLVRFQLRLIAPAEHTERQPVVARPVDHPLVRNFSGGPVLGTAVVQTALNDGVRLDTVVRNAFRINRHVY